MNQKLIKLSETHYIIVDDSEIKEEDWYYDTNNKKSLLPIYQRSQDPKFYKGCKKITHSTEPLELESKSTSGSISFVFHKIKQISLSEVEEAIYGYNVEKKASEAALCNGGLIQTEHEYDIAVSYYYQGFKAHQKLIKDKLFTKKDMINAFIQGTNSGANYESLVDYNFDDKEEFEKFSKIEIKEFKKTLLPKTEWNIKFINNKIKILKNESKTN